MRMNAGRLMLVLLVSAACSADTGLTTPSQERDLIADRLGQFADSISMASDEATAAPYRELSDLVRRTDRPSSVRVTVDGEVVAFSAIAHETVVAGSCTGTESSGGESIMCWRQSRVRTLLAWHAPSRRIMLLTARAERGDFGIPSATANTAPSGLLRFFDQSGRASVAVTGSYSSSVKTDGECALPRRPDGDRVPTKCLFAHFDWALEASGAAITHALRLEPSSVEGTQWTVGAAPPPPAPPTASPLVAALRSHVDSVVSLALVVRNESAAPVSLRFPTAQQYDFAIKDRSGKTVWRWSDGQSFADAPTTRTIPAHESITFTARWSPTVRGELIVVATMTSATQLVSTRAALLVP